MKHILLTAVALAGATLTAVPVTAALGAVVDPCSAGYVSGAMACQGYYGGNLFQGGTGSATTADQQAIINLLLNGTSSTADGSPTNNTAGYNPPYAGLNTSTVLGAVRDNTIRLANGQGSSNAQIFATSVAAVPEPGT